jgi:hypothetical protein
MQVMHQTLVGIDLDGQVDVSTSHSGNMLASCQQLHAVDRRLPGRPLARALVGSHTNPQKSATINQK